LGVLGRTSGIFFGIFRSYLATAVSFKVEKRDSNSQKCHKRLALDKTQRKVTRWLGATQENTWIFFRIFRPYPAPAVGFEVEKTRFYLLKHRKTFVQRTKVGKEKRNL